MEVVKRNELHTFVVLPKRWVVERSFGWLEKCRRLWKNCERKLNTLRAGASARGMNPVIPPKSNRKEKRDYDRALYKLRHLVENGFLEFKQWRGVATRYAKNSLSYLAICQIRAMAIWTKLL